MTSLDDDVQATKRILDQQDGPVVLVGHSWAGTVITQADVDPKVVSLVYVAAFQPDKGENSNQWAGSQPKDPAMRVTADDKGFPVTEAAWKDKPGYGIVATEDKAINPDIERNMYKRANDKITEIKGSHAIFISQPYT